MFLKKEKMEKEIEDLNEKASLMFKKDNSKEALPFLKRAQSILEVFYSYCKFPYNNFKTNLFIK